jgi:hypothetical protein
MILSRVENHSVFRSTGNNPQADPSKQLAVALRRFGAEYSSAGAVIPTSQLFGISEGSVVMYTRRVCIALASQFATVITWPTVVERRTMKYRLREGPAHLFENCIGMIDGTLIPFWTAPGFDIAVKQAYYNYQKGRSGFQATIVCDDRRRIQHFTSLVVGKPLLTRCKADD